MTTALSRPIRDFYAFKDQDTGKVYYGYYQAIFLRLESGYKVGYHYLN